MRWNLALVTMVVVASPVVAAAQPASQAGVQAGGAADTPLGEVHGDRSDEDQAHPWAYSLRPITLPEMTLAPELGFTYSRFSFDPVVSEVFSWSAGASFGILDDLSVEVVPLTFYHSVASSEAMGITFSDSDTDYNYFLAGATYRFWDGVVDIAARFRFAVDSYASVFFNPGFLVRLRHEVVRLDTGVEFMVLRRDESALVSDSEVFVGLQGFGQFIDTPRAGIPVELAFQIVEPFWVGLNTGIGIADFTADDVGDTVFMPLGWGVGGTVPYDDHQPLMDISGGFGFPLFLVGAAEDQPVEEFWQIGIKATGFIYL